MRKPDKLPQHFAKFSPAGITSPFVASGDAQERRRVRRADQQAIE